MRSSSSLFHSFLHSDLSLQQILLQSRPSDFGSHINPAPFVHQSLWLILVQDDDDFRLRVGLLSPNSSSDHREAGERPLNLESVLSDLWLSPREAVAAFFSSLQQSTSTRASFSDHCSPGLCRTLQNRPLEDWVSPFTAQDKWLLNPSHRRPRGDLRCIRLRIGILFAYHFMHRSSMLLISKSSRARPSSASAQPHPSYPSSLPPIHHRSQRQSHSPPSP